MARAVTVELDDKGRVHIPSSVRREVKTRRFNLYVQGGKILMEPVRAPTTVRGKYKGLIGVSVEQLEEAQESFVTAGHR